MSATSTPDLIRIDLSSYLDLTSAILEAKAVPATAARLQAEVLATGDLRGHPSHGLRRLDMLARRIDAGLIDVVAQPTLIWRTRSALMVDGHQGLGPPVAFRVVEELLERSRATGLAVAAIRGANHLGMLAPYVERIADEQAIGVALTTSEALVHPWGGRDAMVGTNPIAIGLPTGDAPIVLDMATGQISMGKVLDHAARGLPLPEGAAVDAEGRPTTDAGAAANGAISPMGGPKGYALAVTLEILVATLTGTALGNDVVGTLDATSPSTKGDLLFVLDPAAFGSQDLLPVRQYLDALRAVQPAPGHEAVTVPGDRARQSEARNRSEGLPVSTATWERVQQLALSVGVALPHHRHEGPG